MVKIIPLPNSPAGYSRKAQKTAYLAFGTIWLIVGISKFFQGPPFEYVFGIFYSLSGLIFIYVSSASLTSRFTPKAIIDEEQLRLKRSVFSKFQSFNWSEIKAIRLGSYSLGLTFQTGEKQTIKYQTDTEASLELKAALREVADKLGIPITY